MRDKPSAESHSNPFVGHFVYMDRVRNVFYALRSTVCEENLWFTASLVVNALAYTHRSRRCQGLKPSRDIDAVSVDVSLIDEDVARIDPDAQPHGVWLIHLARRKSSLNIKRATYRID